MPNTERRALNRISSHIELNMIGFTLYCRGEREDLEIINFNSAGACLKLSSKTLDPRRPQSYIFARMGIIELEREIEFEIVWETIEADGRFGVSFKNNTRELLDRSERFIVNNLVVPTYTAQDPLDIHRLLYFRVINISNSGMLLESSLSNCHLVPGMRLRRGTIEIPNQGSEKLELFIENIRPIKDRLRLGVSYIDESAHFRNLISKHILETSAFVASIQTTLENIKAIGPAPKQIKKAITIREINNPSDYEEVKDLRYRGYKKAGKLKDHIHPSEMGLGLEREGLVLGAYLSGKLVASAEARLSRNIDLSIFQDINKFELEQRFGSNLYEINKLVVDPSLQRSDVVLALFQKIHTIAMLNQLPTCLILADDKLSALYRRLGFKEAGFKKPHPVIKNVNLNLMYIQAETYAQAQGMNQLAWSRVYKETSAYLNEIGMADSIRINLWKKMESLFSSLFNHIQLIRKKTVEKNKSDVNANNGLLKAQHHHHENSIDPRWVKQHINATVLIPYIDCAEEIIGHKIREILGLYNMEKDYFQQETNWVSIEFFDRLHSDLEPHMDLYLLNQKAGARFFKKEVLKSNYYLLKYVVDPFFALRQYSTSLSRFNKTREVRITPLSGHAAKIRILNLDPHLLPKHPAARENWIASFKGLFTVMFNKPPEIRSISNSWEGAPYCEFVITWNSRLFEPRNIIYALLTSFGVFIFTQILKAKYDFSFSLVFSSLVLVGSVLYFGRHYRRLKEGNADLKTSFNEFIEKSDHRYNEMVHSKFLLEESLQEQRLMQNLMEKIMASADIVEILDTALTVICTEFSYKRAFIMLKEKRDPQGELFLRPARLFGEDEDLSRIWNFKVPLNGLREGGAFLSTAFYTGQSIMINNPESHMNILREDSKALIESLESKAFCIVAIPTKDNQHQGVLIADKGKDGSYIKKRDIQSLERICQILSLALDNHERYSKEVALRGTISKFISPTVLDRLIHQTPEKIAYTTNVSAMIFDLADSVSLSKVLPLEIYNNYINTLFEFLDEALNPTGGVVNKYLGDGGLVIWDESINVHHNPHAIIAGILSFFEKVKTFNASELKNQGLPPFRLRVGLSRGEVRSGLVGSSKKFEWTYTGTTIGLAARNEQLNKSFDSNIALSRSFIDFDQLNPLDWQIVTQIRVKEGDAPIDAAIFKYDFHADQKTKKVEAA